MHSHQRVLTRFNSIEPLSENIARCFKLTLSVLLAPVPSWLGSDDSAPLACAGLPFVLILWIY